MARTQAWLWAALALGCANTHSVDDATTPDASTPMADANVRSPNDDILALEAAWRATCTRRMACLPVSSVHYGYFRECELDGWPWIEDRVRSGALRVDVDAARRCVDAIATLPPCLVRGVYAQWGVLPFPYSVLQRDALDACEHLYVEEPPTCGDETCAPEDWCLADANCASHCTHIEHHEGDRCRPFGCGPDLECQGETCHPPRCADADCLARGLDHCLDGVCVRHPRLGDACGPSLYSCIDSVCVDGTCVAALPDARLGEHCGGAVGCVAPLTCDMATSTCLSWFESSGFCLSSFDCPAGTFCHAPPASTLGDACSPVAEGALCITSLGPFVDRDVFVLDSCPADLTCIRGRCGRFLPDGSACASEAECARGSICVDEHCVHTPLPWEPCGPDAPCAPDFICLGERCTRHTGAHVGDACRGDRCDEGRCIGGSCRWVLPGEPCSRGECPSCVDGICEPYAGARGSSCDPWVDACAAGLSCSAHADGTGQCCN